MTTTLQFVGTVSAPAPSHCIADCGAASGLTVMLDELLAEFGEVLSGTYELASAAGFQQLEAVGQLDVLEFLSISLAEGQTADVEILLGRPPTLLGAAGVFPLVASLPLVFELRDMTTGPGGSVLFTITANLQLGDTAVVAAQRINAAALLAGVPAFVATVTGGQLQLSGNEPGARRGLNVTTTNAGAGFPTAGLVVGLGSPYLVDRVWVQSLAASPVWTGEDVWIRGGAATLHFIAAGS